MHLYLKIQQIILVSHTEYDWTFIHLFDFRESVQIHYVALDDREQCTLTSIAI